MRQVPLSWLPKKLVSLWNGDTTRSPVRADTQTSAEKAAKSIPLGEGFTRCEELVQKFCYAAETGEPPRTPAPSYIKLRTTLLEIRHHMLRIQRKVPCMVSCRNTRIPS